MCRCWLRCWEDFYWNCIEEKFCYDETIANYNPDDDEYFQKKTNGNGFLSAAKLENNNSSPVCIQPALGRSNSRAPGMSAGKIHEDDYRQIQINAPILAPEIMSVFSNSQIFHEHHPVIKKPSSTASFPGVHGKSAGGREADSEKLLFRLEGNDTAEVTRQPSPPQIDVTDHSLAHSKQFPSIREEDELDGGCEVVLRPHVSADSIGDKSTGSGDNGAINRSTPVLNKRLRNVQSVPYFPFRPASENDIFSISGSMGQISMTPEIPSISYSTLPKNYEDTPTIEKYKESVSLYSMQTAQSARMSQLDFSMPRYFRRSGAVVTGGQSMDNLSMGAASGSGGSGGGGGNGGVIGGGGAMVFSHPRGERATATDAGPKAAPEKSKRLKLLRTKLPPLSIHLGGARERSKDKGIE